MGEKTVNHGGIGENGFDLLNRRAQGEKEEETYAGQAEPLDPLEYFEPPDESG